MGQRSAHASTGCGVCSRRLRLPRRLCSALSRPRRLLVRPTRPALLAQLELQRLGNYVPPGCIKAHCVIMSYDVFR